MNKLLFSGVLITTIFLVQFSSFAQSLPRLRRNMNYAQARTLLIRRGWRPVVNSEQVNNPNRSGVIDYLIKKGYPEVVDCSGTGLGLCLFQFRNARGQTLFVSTANNQPRQESTIYNWRVE
ncbi:hypothetical protein [Argonema antarcticum]|uniref:hypothetical protein n=1 Tax=Argonema antarcticum TaxID=2942763 RepID=UPI0020121DD0|nr:hypothetical protein [Argonema antarcticum]MCL1472712.1 hypothetical protein [Argonema antarcticum A004/B2]